MNTFEKARVRLTLLYVLIASVLLFFATSAAIVSERRAFDRIEQALSDRVERPKLTALLEQRLNEFETQFIYRLLFLDGILLIGALLGSYSLSGRTLKPIRDMIKEQENFSADASHELRTPLTTMSLEIQAFKRTQRMIPRQYTQVFSTIEEEVARMRGIVEGLLTLVRVQQPHLRFPMDVINLTIVAKSSVDQMKTLAEKKHISVVFRSAADIRVLGNPEWLKQVMLILLDNAIKYTPKDGSINVSIHAIRQHALLTVADSGTGILPEDLPHVSERFYRGKQKASIPKGTGLGLSIAKQIIAIHRGSISVESTIGKGTTVTVTLPLHS
ncbi:MAG: HAMP domain-containing sensor histidine kinase [bacterium]|nr:HAMP domain-containing sensor histidine kinase [bacterium]